MKIEINSKTRTATVFYRDEPLTGAQALDCIVDAQFVALVNASDELVIEIYKANKLATIYDGEPRAAVERYITARHECEPDLFQATINAANDLSELGVAQLDLIF